MPVPVDVPDRVRQRALADGEAGRRWLDDLPGAVAALADRWGLELGESLPGGTASLVTTATDRSGRACVVKLPLPLESEGVDAFRHSVLAHRLADGRGCARLLGHQESPPALLLERLGPNLHELGLELPQVMEAIATTLGSFWRPVPDGCDLPGGDTKAMWLAHHIRATWEELDRPCPREVVDRAVAYCDERASAFDPSQAVLVHGDAHGWNTLAAGEGTWKLVDPEGLRSEPAHDLGVAMREYNEPLLAGSTARLVRERAELLASLCEVDPEALWQWGFVERVSTGLAGLRAFDGDESGAFLEVASRCL